MRKVEGGGESIVSSVRTSCLQESQVEMSRRKVEIRDCSAGQRGLFWKLHLGVTSVHEPYGQNRYHKTNDYFVQMLLEY